jgi:hypothetical protein
MKITTVSNIIIAVGMAGALAYVWPDDEYVYSSSQAAAMAEQSESIRLAKAAQDICGPNAAWDLIDAKTIQCFTHTGKKQ